MKERNSFKLILSVLIANGIRLLRIIPNSDPIMSMALPFSRRGSALTSFTFPFVTMASFDVVTGYVGLWTLVTSITYGLQADDYEIAAGTAKGLLSGSKADLERAFKNMNH